ncbi:unnamed protein product [Ilex paraguariensis]|uniref:Uncharacterized protein n=1 Tax=Ilex paraguariensis TaxID=185542 RepID=A0ABC8SSF7_9AQUA
MCQTELGGDLEARSSETILQVLKETSRNGKEPHAAFGLSIYAPMSLIVHNGTPVDLHQLSTAEGAIANFPPYGVDFPNRSSTGRFTNGYTIADVLGEYSSSRFYNHEQFGEFLAKELGQSLKDLYNLGARKFVVSDIGPLGCLAVVMENIRPKTRCAEDVNSMESRKPEKHAVLLGGMAVDNV